MVEPISSNLILILVFDKSLKTIKNIRSFWPSPRFVDLWSITFKVCLKSFILDDSLWWRIWSLGRDVWCQPDSSSTVSCLQDRTNCKKCHFHKYFLHWNNQLDCRSCWTYNVCLLRILWPEKYAMGQRMGSNDTIFDSGNIVAVPRSLWTVHGFSFCWNLIYSIKWNQWMFNRCRTRIDSTGLCFYF